MFQYLSNFIVLLVSFSGLVGLFCYEKLPNFKARLPLFLILFSFVIELVGRFSLDFDFLKNNNLIVLYTVFSFSGYFILFSKLLKNKQKSNFSLLSLVFFWLYFIYDFNYNKHHDATFSNYFAFGVVLTVVLSCLYFFEILNSDKVENFKKSFFFWYVLGILIFHIPMLPLMASFNFFLDLKSSFLVFDFILFLLNLLMHLCFIIGFIWSEKKYNY